MQLQELHSWVPSIGLNYQLGVDGLSLPLVLINAALTLVAAVCTRDFSKRPRIYFAMLLLISGAVNGAFLAENLLLFFLFYELELIPLWLLISIWGGNQRAYAATKFLIFTAVSGMLILGAFLGLALFTGTVDFSLTPITSERLAMGSQIVLLSALLVGFGIKLPLVPFHTWLPDAHTQASTPVSVLLAGVLLKLGTYGILRFGMGLFPEAWAKLAPGLAIWAAITVVYGSLAAIAQTGHETDGGLQLRGSHGLCVAGRGRRHAGGLAGGRISDGEPRPDLRLAVPVGGHGVPQNGHPGSGCAAGPAESGAGPALHGHLDDPGGDGQRRHAWHGRIYLQNSWCSAAVFWPIRSPPCFAWWDRA